MSDALKDELDYWRAVWEREIAEAHAKLAIHQSAIRQRGCECHTCRALGELAEARALLARVMTLLSDMKEHQWPACIESEIASAEMVLRDTRAFLRGDEAPRCTCGVGQYGVRNPSPEMHAATCPARDEEKR